MTNTKCRICTSEAINPRQHGRDPKEDLDLCDVCYWRVRAVCGDSKTNIDFDKSIFPISAEACEFFQEFEKKDVIYPATDMARAAFDPMFSMGFLKNLENEGLIRITKSSRNPYLFTFHLSSKGRRVILIRDELQTLFHGAKVPSVGRGQ